MKASTLAAAALIAALALSCGRSAAPLPEAESKAQGQREPPFKIVVLVPAASEAAASAPATAGGFSDGLTAGLAPGMATVVRFSGRLSAGNPAWEQALDLAGREPYKAVAVLSAPLGTVGLFEALRERRPDILLISLSYTDDPLAMQAVADLALTLSPEARGAAFLQLSSGFDAAGIVHAGTKSSALSWEAIQRGASLARLAEERGLSYEYIEISQADMRKNPALAATALVAGKGLNAEGGAAPAAGQRWVFTSDEPEFAERLLYAALDAGAYYIEGAAPPYGVRYGGAENLDDLPRAFDGVALGRNAPGRAAFWPGEQAETLGRAVLAHVASSVDKPALLRDAEALAKALRKAWPASAWAVENFRDPDTQVRAKNHLTLASYAYVAGRGYIKF